MPGNERGDHQAWLDWTAYGVRARRDREGRIQLADWKEASPRPSSSTPDIDGGSRKRRRVAKVAVPPKVKRVKARFVSYQARLSRAVTGKDDNVEFIFLDLGYTVEQLKAHLERQFTSRMSWKNYAGNLPYQTYRKHWHIDHITPKSKFALDDVRGAFALSNLRPLWSWENMAKSARKTHLL